MAEIEQAFEIDNCKFRLILKSANVEAHSVMSSNKAYDNLKDILRHPILGMDSIQSELRELIKAWKEKYKG